MRPRWVNSLLFRIATLAVLAVCGGCVALRGEDDTTVRIETPLSQDWRFHLGQPAGDPSQPGFDDAGWQAVAVPHTWNALGEYRIGRTAATRNTQGVGWYRRWLDAATLPARSRHFLQFDAVGNIADVWINGRHVGRHAGAFSRFRFDITDHLRPGRNLVAVRADNSLPAPGSTTEDVVPLKGDFFVHGGLYRGVSLVSVGDAHIALDDFGGPGVYATTASVDAGGAVVEVVARLGNAASTPVPAVLRLSLRDADGREVAEEAQALTLAPGRTEASMALLVDAPRLWDGRRDPHLYRLSATLERDDVAVDRVEQAIGLRTVRIDPDRGFFLNGRHLPLHGVSRHQDLLGRGWALTEADHERDMALIVEMGANSVRFAHYQHAREWFDLADREGMMVWAELALVNKVSLVDAPASPGLVANARTQLVEQIRQHYNNPSVATWGIGNEVNLEIVMGSAGRKADPRPLLRELHALAKAEDPSRPTVVADCCEDTEGPGKPDVPAVAGIADLIGYNRYYGWYYGKVDDLGPHLDALHAKHPGLPISVSEYGAGAALSQHADNPQGGRIEASGRPHPEEFQSWFHERHWPQIAARGYLWGSWIWNMFDFSSTVRQEGDATDINDKGLVSFDRKVRKDAFYYYKALWSDAPVLHITGRRHVERAYPVVDVRVYSNADRVALSLNGASLGEADCVDRICVFPQVRLAPGRNRVEARAQVADVVLMDVVEWSAPDARVGLAINVGDLAQATMAGRRYGSDAFFEGGEGAQLAPAQLHAIDARPDAALLRGYRRGDFSYLLPLPAGCWRISITSMMPVPDATVSRFDAVLPGQRAVRNLTSGQFGNPAVREFEAKAGIDGLRLEFRGDAVLSALDASPCSGVEHRRERTP